MSEQWLCKICKVWVNTITEKYHRHDAPEATQENRGKEPTVCERFERWFSEYGTTSSHSHDLQDAYEAAFNEALKVARGACIAIGYGGTWIDCTNAIQRMLDDEGDRNG